MKDYLKLSDVQFDRLQHSTQPFGRIRLKSQFGCMGLSIDRSHFRTDSQQSALAEKHRGHPRAVLPAGTE